MIIKVKIKPGSNEESLEKISNTEYKAKIKALPEKNQANIRLIKLLAKEFNAATKSIKIKNLSSKNKIIEIKQ